MLDQIIVSAPLPYRLPWSTNTPLYNSYLTTSPRVYGEELHASGSLIQALFARRASTPTSGLVITMIVFTSQIYTPGWDARAYTWDSATGAFISSYSLEWGGVYVGWVHSITQGFDNSLWMNQLGDTMRELTQDLKTETGAVYDANHFSRVSVNYPVVDRWADVVVMAAESGTPQIQVYTLSTGVLLRSINVPGSVRYISPEDNGKVYVLCDYNIFCLVDYVSGSIAYTGKLPHVVGSISSTFSWDTAYRRLWVFRQMPNAVDGASQSYMTAYYPSASVTNLVKPVLLSAPRANKTIKMVTRTVGDVGEPVGTRVVRKTATGGATVDGLGSVSSGDGYATLNVSCISPGSASVTTTITV